MLCIWVRQHFWTATVIGSSIWLFRDAVDHLWDIFINKNLSEINTGIVFYSDLVNSAIFRYLVKSPYSVEQKILQQLSAYLKQCESLIFLQVHEKVQPKKNVRGKLSLFCKRSLIYSSSSKKTFFSYAY